MNLGSFSTAKKKKSSNLGPGKWEVSFQRLGRARTDVPWSSDIQIELNNSIYLINI